MSAQVVAAPGVIATDKLAEHRVDVEADIGAGVALHLADEPLLATLGYDEGP